MSGLQNLDIGITAFDPVTAVLLLDELGVTATRAYSTRKLRSAYAGSAIRIRRSSDNAEQDIGFSGENLDTAAITTFVGANSAYVVTWYDQSGSADNVTQATAANQPRMVNAGTLDVRNTKPALVFDATNDVLTSSTTLTAQEGSMIVATAQAGPTWSGYPTIFNGSTSDGAGSKIGIVGDGGGSGNYYTAGLAVTSSVNNSGSAAAVFGSVLQQVRCNSPGALSWDHITFGKAPGGAYWNGWTGEAVIFASVLSAGNRTVAYNNQKAYWGTP